MCEPFFIFLSMSRWLLWLLCLGAALLAHAGLLLIPLPDDPLAAGSPATEIAVHLLDTPAAAVQKKQGEKAEKPIEAVAKAAATDSVPSAELEMPPVVSRSSPPEIPPRQSVMPPPQKTVKQPVPEVVAAAPAPVAATVAAALPAKLTDTAKHSAAVVQSVSGENAVNSPNLSPTAVAQQVARSVSQRKPKYPRRAIVRNQEGSVRVELLIRTDGRVEQAVLLESSGYPLLDKSVMDFVEKEQFYAALEKGVPVASKQLYTYRFVLN